MTRILVCRISWMQEYRSEAERAFSYHRYILEGNTPYESLNFLKGEDGLYRGYVPMRGDDVGNFGKINIDSLGARRSDDSVTGILVVFCATHESEGGLRVVGFYRNATVLRNSEVSDLPGRTRVTRILSNDAVLIPASDRVFTIPGRHDGGMGQSNLWYGANKIDALREQLINYAKDTELLPESQSSVKEYRKKGLHERWEGRGAARGFIHEKGFCCEGCGYSIEEKDKKIWGSGFELHHLLPWSQMNSNTVREVTINDFAVLCATCHRAIHRSDYVSDVEGFRKRVVSIRSKR